MNAPEPATYSIPLSFRRLENQHILFWLVKDVSWCMLWRPLGIMMMIPTLAIAVIIYWRTRHLPAERAHNLAILCWITANSYWMMSEFLAFDTQPLFGGAITGKQLALVPFSAGLLVLAIHYGRAFLGRHEPAE
jgi:hypothetical protein